MTMEFEVTNTSTNYAGRVETRDKTPGSDPGNLADVHILKPGESVKLTIWDSRYLVLKEVGEVKESQKIDGTDESESGESNTEQPT